MSTCDSRRAFGGSGAAIRMFSVAPCSRECASCNEINTIIMGRAGTSCSSRKDEGKCTTKDFDRDNLRKLCGVFIRLERRTSSRNRVE